MLVTVCPGRVVVVSIVLVTVEVAYGGHGGETVQVTVIIEHPELEDKTEVVDAQSLQPGPLSVLSPP